MIILRQSNLLEEEKNFSIGSRLKRARYNYKDTYSFYKKEGKDPEKSIAKYRKDLEKTRDYYNSPDSDYVDFDDENNKIIYKNALTESGKPLTKTYKDKKRYEFEKSELKKSIKKERDKYNSDEFIESELRDHMDKLSHPKKVALKAALKGLHGDTYSYD